MPTSAARGELDRAEQTPIGSDPRASEVCHRDGRVIEFAPPTACTLRHDLSDVPM